MITRTEAEQFIQSWTGAWNAHDIDAILSHFTDDVENSTPLIESMLGIGSGTTKGRDAARHFWEKILSSYPDMSISAIESWGGTGLLSVHWRVITRGKSKEGTDTFFLTDDMKASKVVTAHVLS